MIFSRAATARDPQASGPRDAQQAMKWFGPYIHVAGFVPKQRMSYFCPVCGGRRVMRLKVGLKEVRNPGSAGILACERWAKTAGRDACAPRQVPLLIAPVAR